MTDLVERPSKRIQATAVESLPAVDDATLSIDDERGRNVTLPERIGEPKILVHELRITNPMFADKRIHGTMRLAHRNADDERVTASGRSRRQAIQRVDLARAGDAPSGPETEQRNASAHDA
jgi:hypothetical protein